MTKIVLKDGSPANNVQVTRFTRNVAEDKPSRLAQFDAAIQKVTQERGSVYGPPSIDFERANKLKSALADCKDPLARHALEMICGKIARLIQTPDHLDSWIDIAGYARCGVMVTDHDKVNNP